MISYYQKILDLNKFEVLNLVVGYCKGTLWKSKLQIFRPNATAQMLLVSEM